jgi:hypothetical protein
MTRPTARWGVLAVVLVASFSAGAQSSSGASHPRKATQSSAAQQSAMLEQLNARIAKLESANANYGVLQQEIDDLKKQLQEANGAAAAARQEASQARQDLASITGHNEESVKELQSTVNDLKANSLSIVGTIQSGQAEVAALKNPEAMPFRGVRLTPGGFMAAETVWRQRGIGGDINTSFSTIPFPGQSAGELSEFNASARQSRMSLLVEGKLPKSTFRGYFESDFLSAGTTSNDNQSNSYTLRVRQAWAQALLGHGWDLTTGQMWSLATEDRSGLAVLQEAIPQTIDSQYTVGFSWARQYGFRVTRQLNDHLWAAGSIEAAETLNIGGHNLPTLLYQQTGNPGGLYNSTANYSFNYAPDVLAKLAYQTPLMHVEVFGVGRFFRDRVFPNGPPPPGAPQPPTTSALDAFTSKAFGGGVGANGRVFLLNRALEIAAHGLVGSGIGRYSSATLPDATAHPDGSLEPLVGGSALGSVEWHHGGRLDLYAYYGGEYARRAYYNSGYFVITPGPTQGQPILVGYGAPNNPVYGCNIEVLPISSPNGGGSVPGSAANCLADNRNIQEGSTGYWFRIYQGTRGTFQQGIQYSYLVRHTWQGIGDPLTGLGGSPKAIDNMVFTSFRYYLPK